MSKRDKILSLRGNFVAKTICTSSDAGVMYALVAHGYENYPEPQFYSVTVDGKPILKSNGNLLFDYSEIDLLDKAAEFTSADGILALEFVLNSTEDYPW